MDFVVALVYLGVFTFLAAFVLTVTLARSARAAAALAVFGSLAIAVLLGVVVATASTEPVHDTAKTFGRYVSPYLWFFAGLNLLGWSLGVLLGWAVRKRRSLVSSR